MEQTVKSVLLPALIHVLTRRAVITARGFAVILYKETRPPFPAVADVCVSV